MNPKTEIVKALTRSIQKCRNCAARTGGDPCVDCRQCQELIVLLNTPNVVIAFQGGE